MLLTAHPHARANQLREQAAEGNEEVVEFECGGRVRGRSQRNAGGAAQGRRVEQRAVLQVVHQRRLRARLLQAGPEQTTVPLL